MTLQIVRANYEARAEKMGELRAIDEAAVNRVYTEDETAKVEELRSELAAIDARIQSGIEQEIRSIEIDNGLAGLLGAVVDKDHGEVVDTRSIGERFTEGDGYTNWAAAGARGSYAVDMPGLSARAVTDTTLGATSGGALTRPERLDRIGRDFLDRRVFLLDLLPHIPVGQGTVEYVQDKSPLADMANKAVEVAEAGAKPQAGITLQVISEAIAVIAAWANITRQAAADVAQIQGYLDTRLRYSLKRRSDGQSINGDGVSPNLRGLANRSGILTYAPGGAEARYKSIRRGIRLMEDAEVVPEIIVLNPADAEIFDLSNEATAGLHAVNAMTGDLQSPSARTAWGLTQVRSTALASGTALLIDPMAVAVLDRQAPTAYMTDSHASNFTSNILTLLLELRLGLALFEPSGVCKITFNGSV
jgi:HK97 family phage major capsid protein